MSEPAGAGGQSGRELFDVAQPLFRPAASRDRRAPRPQGSVAQQRSSRNVAFGLPATKTNSDAQTQRQPHVATLCSAAVQCARAPHHNHLLGPRPLASARDPWDSRASAMVSPWHNRCSLPGNRTQKARAPEILLWGGKGGAWSSFSNDAPPSGGGSKGRLSVFHICHAYFKPLVSHITQQNRRATCWGHSFIAAYPVPHLKCRPRLLHNPSHNASAYIPRRRRTDRSTLKPLEARFQAFVLRK